MDVISNMPFGLGEWIHSKGGVFVPLILSEKRDLKGKNGNLEHKCPS